MKKILAFLIALVMVLSTMSFVAAGSGYSVTIVGNGNNGRIQVTYNGSQVYLGTARPANNATTRVTTSTGTEIDVVIHGNSVRLFNVVTEAFADKPSVNAGTQNAPNHSSGGAGVQRINNVEIRGNGNSARIWVDNTNTNVRPANNTYTTIEHEGYTVVVFVRGNAILSVNVTAPVVECDEPVVVRTGTITRRVVVGGYNVYEFYGLGARTAAPAQEVAGSRSVYGLVVAATADRGPVGTEGGMGYFGGFTAIGTLNFTQRFTYNRMYEAMYETVEYTVWSDDTTTYGTPSEPFANDELVARGTELGAPVAGSRAINVASHMVEMARGFGQTLPESPNRPLRPNGDPDNRLYNFNVGGFTVQVYMANTGTPPDIRIISSSYNLSAL